MQLSFTVEVNKTFNVCKCQFKALKTSSLKCKQSCTKFF